MQHKVRRRMILSGSVQGVGLRYHTRYAANMLDLTGWVENQWDGTVVLEAQGSPEAVEQLLPMIQQGSFISIDDVICTNEPLVENERGFKVRGY